MDKDDLEQMTEEELAAELAEAEDEEEGLD